MYTILPNNWKKCSCPNSPGKREISLSSGTATSPPTEAEACSQRAYNQFRNFISPPRHTLCHRRKPSRCSLSTCVQHLYMAYTYTINTCKHSHNTIIKRPTNYELRILLLLLLPTISGEQKKNTSSNQANSLFSPHFSHPSSVTPLISPSANYMPYPLRNYTKSKRKLLSHLSFISDS